jgi:antagonist of KipI
MAIRVIKPGAYTTVQDTGRYGYQRYGVPVGGSMDRFAGALANILCGNPWDAALLEISFHGTRLFFDEDHLVAFTGGGARAFTDEGAELPMNRAIFIPQFSVIDTRYHPEGSRLYMALAGGIDVTNVMNSRSSYPPAGVDHQLRDKEIYRTLPVSAWAGKVMAELGGRKVSAAKWGPADPMISYGAGEVRAMKGPEWERFGSARLSGFFAGSFGISRDSDRMGYRLDSLPGTESPALTEPYEMISTAVTKGTVQVVPGGELMVLMSDAQTTGGYPRIAQVIAADLPLLAQKKPGDTIVFREVSAGKAEELYLTQIRDLLRLEKNCKAKYIG